MYRSQKKQLLDWEWESDQNANKTYFPVNQIDERGGRAGLKLQVSYDTQINLPTKYADVEVKEDTGAKART